MAVGIQSFATVPVTRLWTGEMGLSFFPLCRMTGSLEKTWALVFREGVPGVVERMRQCNFCDVAEGAGAQKTWNQAG